MTPRQFCDHYNACQTGRDFALKYESMEEVWDKCPNPTWLFWIIERHQPLEKDQSVRLAIAFAETVIHLVPESETRPALAIQAAKNWLNDPSDENRAAAGAGAGAGGAAAARGAKSL